MVELTYGPKREKAPAFVPEYVKLDNKVLCFQGVIREDIQDWPREGNRVHLVKVLYFLENDTMKIIEPEVENSGLVQGTMFNRWNSYIYPSTTRNYHWRDLNVGIDVYVFGRTIHLYNCDLWTRGFLKDNGIEVNEAEPTPENPILLERKAMENRNEIKNTPVHELHPSSRFYAYDGKVLRFYGIFKNDCETPIGIRDIILNVVPVHELGRWEETLEDCFKPHAKLAAKVRKISDKPPDIAETILRFSAFLETPRETEQDRVFVISYFMEDDTVKIHENRVINSGHSGGTFLGRSRLRKDLGKTMELTPALAKGAKPQYYEPSDFYIGAKIFVNGSKLVIRDADLAAFLFMENHPEIYPDINPKEQRELADFLKGYIKPSHKQRMKLLDELKEEVLFNYGSTIFPYPKTLNLGSHYRYRSIVEEQLYSANLPISQATLTKLLDAFTFQEKVDVDEVKTFLVVAFGHDRCH